MDPNIEHADTRRSFARHLPDGEMYVVEHASEWDDDRCVGARIIAVCGPLHHSEWDYTLSDTGEATAATYDVADNCPNLTAADADWMQAEDEAGRVSYPYGTR